MRVLYSKYIPSLKGYSSSSIYVSCFERARCYCVQVAYICHSRVNMAVQVSRIRTLHLNIFADQSLFSISSLIDIQLPATTIARYIHFAYYLSSTDASLTDILLFRLGTLGANPTVPTRTHRPTTANLATSHRRPNTTTTLPRAF